MFLLRKKKDVSIFWMKKSALSVAMHIEIFYLFLPENRFSHFMQIVSSGDNLHEMSNPVFWEKICFFCLLNKPRGWSGTTHDMAYIFHCRDMISREITIKVMITTHKVVMISQIIMADSIMMARAMIRITSTLTTTDNKLLHPSRVLLAQQRQLQGHPHQQHPPADKVCIFMMIYSVE